MQLKDLKETFQKVEGTFRLLGIVLCFACSVFSARAKRLCVSACKGRSASSCGQRFRRCGPRLTARANERVSE